MTNSTVNNKLVWLRKAAVQCGLYDNITEARAMITASNYNVLANEVKDAARKMRSAYNMERNRMRRAAAADCNMKLIDLLKLIQSDQYPLRGNNCTIDSRPDSVFTITICFMSENETWVTVNVASEILVPWYDCKVQAIQGGSGDKKNNIEVWLRDVDYVKKHWARHIKWADDNGGVQNADN